MIISQEKYCIASKSFPLKFLMDGYEYDVIDDVELMGKNDCENELKSYDDPESFQILKVKVTYEF